MNLQGEDSVRIGKISLLLCALILVMTACAPKLRGIDLGKDRSPDFRLNDARGESVALSDYRGKVVVLSFLYTNCLDECPLIASKLRSVANQLGDSMKQVAYVAVSVDPEYDTPAAVQEFLQVHNLDGKMRYLIGTKEQLEPIWKAYYVGTLSNASSVNPVAHTTRTLIIDKQGNQRIELGTIFDPADAVYNVRALLAE
ncbi:MAG: SCO family protein [Chloroflexi bacterium]|nr:SCO family protein [Chloroflexota bacterium]